MDWLKAQLPVNQKPCKKIPVGFVLTCNIVDNGTSEVIIKAPHY